MKITKLTLLFVLIILVISVNAQSDVQIDVSKTAAVKIGTTIPIKDLIKKDIHSKERKEQWKQVNRPPKDMKYRGKRNVLYPELEHQGPDQIRQTGFSTKSYAAVKFEVNMNGLQIGSPADPTGDIGSDYYLQAVNATKIAVFEKNGEKVSEFTGNSLWEPLGFSSAGDPIILFDQDSSRWIITEFPSGNELLVAISKTTDPLGSYDVYNFSTPNFPDYPKYGLWKNSITVTTNEQGTGEIHLYVLNREQLLAGEEVIQIQRIALEGKSGVESGFFVATPVDWTGDLAPNDGDGPYFVSLDDSSWGSSDMDNVDLWELSINWDDPEMTEVTKTDIITAPFDPYPCKAPGVGFSCIPQPSTNGLDGIPDLVMFQPHYRKFESHESMIMSFITDVTDGENISGIRWMELRRTEDSNWELYQEGTFAPDDGLHRFIPSICMDKYGNIALAYSISNEETFPGLRLTGRFSNDPLGQMTIPETSIVDGTNGISSGGRFGDYAQMTIDPVDGSTFWFTSEYGGDGNNNSTTRIASFKLKREDYDLGVKNSNTPDGLYKLGSKDVMFDMIVSNEGVNSIDEFTVQYISDNFSSQIVTVDSLLYTNDEYVHEFSETQSLDQIGDFDVKFIVNAVQDEVSYNDTLVRRIQVKAGNDLSFDGFSALNGNATSCDSVETFVATLKNEGFDTLTTCTYSILENNSVIGEYVWEGELATDESEVIEIELSGLKSGQNVYTILGSNPNDMTELNVDNNASEFTFTINLNAPEIYLRLLLDVYPAETSWNISNLNGELIAEGGNYSESEELIIPLCLNDSECYVFTINDTYGDGIVLGGSYSIYNAQGDTLASIIQKNFGKEEMNEFCAHGGCNLEYDVVINPTGSSSTETGTIAINVTSGISPFEYSIDGGASYSSTNIFDMLGDGVYDIVVKDAGNCIQDTTVQIDIVSTTSVDISSVIQILPNPNNGYFTIVIEDQELRENRLTYVILDSSGKQINENTIGRFNDAYLGAVNLTSFPDGSYFIFFKGTKLPVTKIVKQ